MYGLRLLEIPSPYRLGQLCHSRNRICLEQILVIEVIKQYIEPLLCVIDLRFERGWCS